LGKDKANGCLTNQSVLLILLYKQGMSSKRVDCNQEFFDAHVSERLQKALLRSIFENYAESSRYCWRYFAAAQAKDLSGTHRRARIEDEWAGIAAFFPREVTVKVQTYENNTGHYNEITCGRVVITQSCVVDPNEVPRQAYFRTTLAQNGQLALFEAIEDTDPDDLLYAILTHGVDVTSRRRSRPGFARFQFPNQDCTKYVDEGIDLFRRFPEIVDEYIPTTAITEAEPKKRRAKRHGTA
jgi:hypothetical protein